MITWQPCDNKRGGISRGSQLIAHRSSCPILSLKKNRCHWAMPDAQNTILTWLQSLITVGPFQQIKLSIQVHRPCMTTSKIFGMWIPCFSLSVTAFAVSIWFHNLRNITGNKFWLLGWVHAAGQLQADWAQLAILFLPYLWPILRCVT